MDLLPTFSTKSKLFFSIMVDFTDKAIEWTEERYCLSVFRDKRFTLPAVIKITSGYYGRTNFEEFYSDEVI